MLSPLRVLIIEDSEDDAALLLRELRRGGYEPTFERVDTPEALSAALDKAEWDVVIADYTMPRFRGTAALLMLREKGLDLPFIFLSGTIGEDTAVEAMRVGADDYVMKGNLKRVLPAVRRAVREAEVRRERNRAEAERTRLLSVLEASLNEIYIFDADTLRFQYVNSGALRNLGYSEDSMRAMSPLDLEPEFSEETFRALTAPLRQHAQEKLVFQTTHRRADGTLYPVEVHLQQIERDRQQVFLAVVLDLTERKQLEAQFLQAQKIESVGRLAGGIAHDFNNLLTAILGHAELLLTDPQLGDRQRGDAEEIKRAGERAAALTRQLLAFSRKQILEPKVVDLNVVVTEMEKMLRRLLGEDIDLVTALDPGLGRIKADPGQIEQVLMNLAVNARDAMPEGGKLTLETANADLDAAYVQTHFPAKAGRYVMLSVSDTGFGMDAETRSHIFEPFFTTKEPGKGTGLGLATVYGIVKQSEGYIWVYSEPGKGTAFKIYLPRVEEESEPLPTPEESGSLPTGSESVLLVEDEAAVRALTARVLRDQGYTVLQAKSGEEALTLLTRRRKPIHLLLTDVVLPGMNGKELADRVHALRPAIRTLYMSGYADQAIVHHGVLERGTAVLQKPFTPASLARKVRMTLDTQ